jgi:ABC-type polysaccharide/polyol phosphate transport system ATPase subunit
VAVVGRNGCGKTTLLRLVAGIYQPTSGELTVLGKPRILFRSYVGFAPELPVVDNVFLFGAVHGIERHVLVEHLRAILEFSELEPLAFLPLKNLSVGQVRRLALTTFVESTSQFIILDEALDNVDADFKRRVMERLRDRLNPEKTLLMTSHDADLLTYFCNQAIWIDQAAVRMQGSVAEVMAAYAKDLGIEAQP